MLKLTRLDHRVVAINPDHIAWVEANPDTTLSLLGDRKIIVRETLDEVCERYIAVRSRIGCAAPADIAPTQASGSRRSSSPSGRPSSTYARSSGIPSAPPPIVIEDGPDSKNPYRGHSYPPGHFSGGE